MGLGNKSVWHKYADTHPAWFTLANEVFYLWNESFMFSANIQEHWQVNVLACKRGKFSDLSSSWQRFTRSYARRFWGENHLKKRNRFRHNFSFFYLPPAYHKLGYEVWSNGIHLEIVKWRWILMSLNHLTNASSFSIFCDNVKRKKKKKKRKWMKRNPQASKNQNQTSYC